MFGTCMLIISYTSRYIQIHPYTLQLDMYLDHCVQRGQQSLSVQHKSSLPRLVINASGALQSKAMFDDLDSASR